jgi:subtilisin family serine protease
MRRALVTLIGGVVLLGGTALAAPNDPGFEQQWNLTKIRADKAWATSKGSGIVVAIVDTGVDLNHVDLKQRLVSGVDLVNPGSSPQDDNGHGTFMAGIVAASTGNGQGFASVAPSAKIMPVKVLESDGGGKPEIVADGIRWATSHGADVINLSLAETSSGGIQLPDDFFSNSELDDAIRDAAASGVFVSIASGNDFESGGSTQTSYDATSPGTLVVGASTSGDKRAAYSNYGQGLDVLAPGGGSHSDPTEAACRKTYPVLSTWWEAGASDRYGAGCGTSMAVAHVSGLAALLRARGYSSSSAAQRIIATAKDLGANGWDSPTGYGRIDALAAVGAAVSQPAPSAPKPPAKNTSPKKKVTAAASPTSAPPVEGTKNVAPTPTSTPTGLLLAANDGAGDLPAPRRTLVTFATALALLVGVAHPFVRIALRPRR